MDYDRYQKESLLYVGVYMDMNYLHPLPVMVKGRIKNVDETSEKYSFDCYGFFTSIKCGINKSTLNPLVDAGGLFDKLSEISSSKKKVVLCGFAMSRKFQVESMKERRDKKSISFMTAEDAESLLDRAINIAIKLPNLDLLR